MKWLTTIAAICLTSICFGQIEVLHFNASFNAANACEWVNDLTDCDIAFVDILAQPDLQKKHKIVVVPTIIVLNNGEEEKRLQANIMMQMESTKEEVQGEIDEIIYSDF